MISMMALTERPDLKKAPSRSLGWGAIMQPTPAFGVWGAGHETSQPGFRAAFLHPERKLRVNRFAPAPDFTKEGRRLDYQRSTRSRSDRLPSAIL